MNNPVYMQVNLTHIREPMRAGERSHVLALLPDLLACWTQDTRPGLSEATVSLFRLSIFGLISIPSFTWSPCILTFCLIWKSVFVSLCNIYECLFWQHAWIWLLWLLSQTWITLLIWKPSIGRLMSTKVLFSLPGYESLFVDQSLAMNRRRDQGKELIIEVNKSLLLTS